MPKDLEPQSPDPAPKSDPAVTERVPATSRFWQILQRAGRWTLNGLVSIVVIYLCVLVLRWNRPWTRPPATSPPALQQDPWWQNDVTIASGLGRPLRRQLVAANNGELEQHLIRISRRSLETATLDEDHEQSPAIKKLLKRLAGSKPTEVSPHGSIYTIDDGPFPMACAVKNYAADSPRQNSSQQASSQRNSSQQLVSWSLALPAPTADTASDNTSEQTRPSDEGSTKPESDKSVSTKPKTSETQSAKPQWVVYTTSGQATVPSNPIPLRLPQDSQVVLRVQSNRSGRQLLLVHDARNVQAWCQAFDTVNGDQLQIDWRVATSPSGKTRLGKSTLPRQMQLRAHATSKGCQVLIELLPTETE